MPSVLIVDDLSAIHEMLAAVIQPTGYEMVFASSGEEALEKYKSQNPDVVLTDIAMQPMDGITLLQQIKKFDPDSIVIMMTGYASTDTAVKALKHSAFDYIQKPFKIDELLRTLKQAVDFRLQSREIRSHAGEDTATPPDLSNRFVGRNPKIQRVLQQTAKLMAGRAPLLLQGERGTGKRTLAEIIHGGGGEDQGSLIIFDCALHDEGIIKSSLIGNAGQGGDLVVRAKGGSLLLQHIDLLPLDYQRALVGVIKGTINETRMICSASADLEDLMDQGKFDDELFYRIAALPIYLPPLRERMDDLPMLVAHFVGEAKNPTLEGSQIEFTPDALKVMSRYFWPGNVAELAQTVTSLASTTEARLIGPDQLSLKFSSLEDWPDMDQFLAQQQAAYFRRVLRACGGDKEKAAQVLGCEVGKLEQGVV